MSERADVKQRFITIKLSELLIAAKDLKAEGFRLGQACATVIDPNMIELLYSFDKDYELVNLRAVVFREEEVESITKIYWSAFIYENEMHDLFGIKFKHMEIDYQGNFFKVAEPTPWNPKDRKDRKGR